MNIYIYIYVIYVYVYLTIGSLYVPLLYLGKLINKLTKLT